MSAQTQRVDVLAIDPRLEKYIATRDRSIAKTQPWSPTPLLDAFCQLLARGSVIVGGRSSCGTSDPSMVVLRYWNEVVSKARSLGYPITEINRPQKNAWATRAGGFWNESEYALSGGASHG